MTVIFDSTKITHLEDIIQKIKPDAVALISDDNVSPLHAKPILLQLHSLGLAPLTYNVPAGETSKSREKKAAIEDFLFEHDCGKNTLLIALGGGVITDLVGFVAATYCRGIPVVFIPTSLMAMVDAAIGGKNGINTTYGKNLLGTIRLPNAVFVSPNYLQTLPDEHYRTALSEVIKYAIIADPELFSLIEENIPAIKERDPNLLTSIIKQCISIKESIVSDDLFDTAKRAVLNFGHTIGHALEHASSYHLSHGQAVGIGLYYESYLAFKAKTLDHHSFSRITALLEAFKLTELDIKNLNISKLMHAIKRDKKTEHGSAHYTLIDGIGSVREIKHPISDSDLEKLFQIIIHPQKNRPS